MFYRLSFAIIILPVFLFAQSQGNTWVFGNGNIIDFNGATPVTSGDGAIDLVDQEMEGTASISNSIGQLLFYSDGRRIWDWNHNVVLDTLRGHQSATHAAYIIPLAESDTEFMLITLDAAQNNLENGMRYSIISACRESGVIPLQINTLLANDMTEKIVGIAKSNGGYWLIGHVYNSNAYMVSEIGSSGVNGIMEYFTGPIHQHANPNSHNAAIGQMKASPNGMFIASAVTNSVKLIDIASFDPSTGDLASIITFATDSTLLGYPNGSYGLSFSSNSQFLYVSSLSDYKVWQYNLSYLPGDISAFLESRYLINSATNQFPGVPESYQQLQLGPDGVIYLNNLGNQYLSIIPFPDLPAPQCGFQDSAIAMAYVSAYGLPSFIDSYHYTASGICEPNGISSTSQGSFTLHPNPAATSTTLTLPVAGSYNIMVLDAMGRVVYQDLAATTSYELTTTNWPHGIYAITATNKEGVRYTGKLVVGS
ncbi:MAG: hypothetical protein ACI85F_002485 [Bacteroidia bacterium]